MLFHRNVKKSNENYDNSQAFPLVQDSFRQLGEKMEIWNHNGPFERQDPKKGEDRIRPCYKDMSITYKGL